MLAVMRDVTPCSRSGAGAFLALPALLAGSRFAPSPHRLSAFFTPPSVRIYGHMTINIPELG